MTKWSRCRDFLSEPTDFQSPRHPLQRGGWRKSELEKNRQNLKIIIFPEMITIIKKVVISPHGEMAEWSIAAVLKTVVP